MTDRPPPLRAIALVVLIVVGIFAARFFGLSESLQAVRTWLEGLGPLAPAAFIGLYILAVVAAVPGSALTVAAGALFGSVVGVVAVSIGSTVGASLAFLVSRYAARDMVAGWLSESDMFRRLDRMSETHGATVVAVTRLVPIFPFNLLNYGFGLTRVNFWTYVFWSWLCMLPGTVVYVVGADAVTSAVASGGVSWPVIVTLASSLILLAALLPRARRILAERDSRIPATPTERAR